MRSANRFEGIDEYAATLIHYKARQLARRREFRGIGQEDLEQEMVLDLLERLPQYDLNRSTRHTFIARVVEHKVARLLEFYSAARRNSSRQTRLDDKDHPDLQTPAADTDQAFDDEAHRRRLGIARRPKEAQRDLRLDLESVLADLPEEMRVICDLLRTKSQLEVAKETGIPRASLYEILQKLKAKLQRAGLEKIS